MIKEKIDIKILFANIEMNLPSNKGKTGSELQHEPFKMFDQSRFQLPFAEGFVQGQEIKDIGVFQGLLGELRMRLRQLRVEIGHRRTLAGMGI